MRKRFRSPVNWFYPQNFGATRKDDRRDHAHPDSSSSTCKLLVRRTGIFQAAAYRAGLPDEPNANQECPQRHIKCRKESDKIGRYVNSGVEPSDHLRRARVRVREMRSGLLVGSVLTERAHRSKAVNHNHCQDHHDEDAVIAVQHKRGDEEFD